MMEISDILSDDSKVENGVWVPYRGARVKIASWASKKYKRLKDALEKPYERQRRLGIKNDEMDKIDTDILCRAMARTIVVGWEDFTHNGKPLPYSENAAYDLLFKSLTFRNDMAVLAADESAYRLEQEAELEKNSEPASPSS
jgi:hypothetical protein